MANNAGGRQGGNNNQMNEHVEFTVRAEEDLYLTGSENTIRRVQADTNYSCLMLKTQRFSSLFRHYAKYHGLRKDDLEYFFVNMLENEDTPESVQLQRGDIIMVRKKRKPEPPEPAANDTEFFVDMKELLDDEEHMDTLFLVHPSPPSISSASGTSRKFASIEPSSGQPPASSAAKSSPPSSDDFKCEASYENMEDDSSALVEIRAHKCVLTARADYFKALFRKNLGVSGSQQSGTFRESKECVIRVEPCFGPKIVRLMLEFLYTNRIECLKVSTRVPGPPSNHSVSLDELLSLLHLADMWQLRDLKRMVEHELIRGYMNVNTVARMFCATDDFHAKRLQKSCLEFIVDNYREVTGSVAFQEEMKHHPHLCIPVLKAAADLIPEPAHKKQRTSGVNDMKESGAGGVGMASSPVPDSDA
ncbi:hypothetical protein ACHAXS_007082 [Conticribra weissflogii]